MAAVGTPQIDTLILSRDEQTIRSFRPLVEVAGLNTQVCRNVDIAVEMLARWRFDAVFVDCESIPEAMSVIQSLRSSPSNRTSVVFALVRETKPAEAFRTGATFVLDKQSAAERARTALRAAYGLMLLGRRRYHRRPVVADVVYHSISGRIQRLSTFNISEGGLGLEGDWEPQVGDRGTIEFQLPDGAGLIQCSAEIVWSKGRRAGMRFSRLNDRTQQTLQEWVLEGLRMEPRATARPGCQPYIAKSGVPCHMGNASA